MILRHVLAVAACLLAIQSMSAAQEPDIYPTAAEVDEWLRKEPLTDSSWPEWKQRLTAWFGDRSRQTDAAYRAAEAFCRAQSDAPGQLPQRFETDHLAWYFLGGSYLDAKPSSPRDRELSETAYRKCVLIAPAFPRGHRNLALALIHQSKVPGGPAGAAPDATRLKEAEHELAEARRLNPELPMSGMDGLVALHWGRFDEAQSKLQQEWNDNRDDLAERVSRVVARFPNDGPLACMHALALAAEGRTREAGAELARARGLGTAPETVFGLQLAAQIEEAAAPGVIERFVWIMLYFALAYAAIMLLMAGAGVVLAMRTRGAGALDLLKHQSPDELLADGQIARAQGETLLARLYGLALMAGLVLFYAAIPFVIAGVLGLTALLLYLIFLGGHIPIKLVIIIAVVGCVSAWAVFKSLFTRPPSGAFGLPKTAEECPRIHQLLAEVAQRVDTDAVDEVFIAPGSAVSVHQEGRGPFGVFGVKRRVLTLGLSTIRCLTVGELKAILAHEYAHFSHKDTFYGRFVYQVHMSIGEALHGMLSSGGMVTYANPFYWFLWLYYKSYALLAAGYSRSREFLADRMAATLYGSDQFRQALTKTCTDGTLFEMTIYNHINQLLAEQKAFVNMYQSFQQYRDEHMPSTEREDLYEKLLSERGSLFASHPTYAERIDAIELLPAAGVADSRPALELFDRPEDVEKELTKFLTEYMTYIQHLHAQAAAQQQT
jgi:Zn-dependent protease with chaperone function